MIGLYLLAAHLVGDFVLQTRWQAAGKLTDSSLRLRHVLTYCIPFIPIAAFYGDGRWRTVAFMALLAFLHFLTDSRRFRSTLGDWIAWNFGSAGDPYELPPNPWAPIPICIDQTLHAVQLALLGALFL